MCCAGLTVCRCMISMLRRLHMGKVSCRMLRALLHLQPSTQVEHACKCLIRCLTQRGSSQSCVLGSEWPNGQGSLHRAASDWCGTMTSCQNMRRAVQTMMQGRYSGVPAMSGCLQGMPEPVIVRIAVKPVDEVPVECPAWPNGRATYPAALH